jgi:hypothetical protein
MAAPLVPSSPIPAPTAAEAEALRLAAAYLNRAGTRTASLLLAQWSPPAVAAPLESLRDSLLAGAALCDGLLDLAPDGGGG